MKFNTAQEACDYAVKKIVEQGKQCVNDYGNCIYSDGKGNRCAFGWLLPENHEVIVNASDYVTSTSYDIMRDHETGLDFDNHVFGKLQRFHDSRNSFARSSHRNKLSTSYGIDTSGQHWQQWVDMAEEV